MARQILHFKVQEMTINPIEHFGNYNRGIFAQSKNYGSIETAIAR
jgi:hypothetical protein